MADFTQMTLEGVIKDIIDGIKVNVCFSSHTVIDITINDHRYHSVYLNAYAQGGYSNIATFHSHIAKLIKATIGVKDMEEKFVSHTIYGELSENKLWKKL